MSCGQGPGSSPAGEGYERARGVLLGLATGDALGTTLEFQRLEAPRFPDLASGPHRDIIGGGPFDLFPGQVTDDTQMACALWTSLIEKEGFVAADVAARYVRWREVAFDIGNQTASALAEVARGAEPARGGFVVWDAGGRHAAGNGALMRTAPIAIAYAGDPSGRRRASMADAAITHFDPRCQLACAAFNSAIAAALNGKDALAMIGAAEHELVVAAADLARGWPDFEPEIARAGFALGEDLAAARRSDPDLYSADLHIHRHQGFVRIAFRLAFWELLHAPTFEAAVVDVVNRGGDADTNGAITGALCGALCGASAIPRPWIDAVLSALPEAPSDPLTRDYHPRLFTTLTCAGFPALP